MVGMSGIGIMSDQPCLEGAGLLGVQGVVASCKVAPFKKLSRDPPPSVSRLRWWNGNRRDLEPDGHPARSVPGGGCAPGPPTPPNPPTPRSLD